MAQKPTKRKAFSFLRSYFDVLNQIPDDKDKLSFLLAVINKQFLDEDPENLSFISNLSYESQRHSIEKSVKGYKDKTKTDLLGNPLEQGQKHPIKDPCQGGAKDPFQQEEEKEEEQEQVKEEEKVKREGFHNIDKLIKIYLGDEKICNAVISNKDHCIKDKNNLVDLLSSFKNDLYEQGRHSETFKEFASYFRNWVKKPKNNKNIKSKDSVKQLKKNIAY